MLGKVGTNTEEATELVKLLWGNVPRLVGQGWQVGGGLSLGDSVPCLFSASWSFSFASVYLTFL